MSSPTDATLVDLRERVIAAHQQRRPLRLRGAGTKDFYGEDATASTRSAATAASSPQAEVLDLRPHCGIVDYEPSELVITARCGTALSEIETALADRDQFLAFEPPTFGADPTIGGVIAAGLSGPRRMYAGAARDFVLGATLLDAHGDILRFGGQVMKNVAGFDVSRLLCGSLGILGVITEVSLKVLPRPRMEATLRFEMPAREAIETFNRWSGQPLPLSAAAWHAGVAWVRLSGATAAVRTALERLGGEHVEPSEAAAWWSVLRDCAHPTLAGAMLWRLSVPDTTPPLDLPGELLMDWGGAVRWYSDASVDTTTSSERAASLAINARTVAAAAGGTALCWRGPTPTNGRFHPLQPAVATLHRRLKDRFDPHGIFNPGRMIAGL